METWSWEWGNISYGVNWNGLANELQGQREEKTRKRMITTTHSKSKPLAQSISEHKKKKKNQKRKEEKSYRHRKSTLRGQASTIANSQPRDIITSGRFSPNPLRLNIQEPA